MGEMVAAGKGMENDWGWEGVLVLLLQFWWEPYFIEVA